MKLFGNKKKKQPTEERSLFCDALNYSGVSAYTGTTKALLLSAVYRCVEVISDSVAQLPLEPFKLDENGYKRKYLEHPTYWLLNREPNKRMTRFTFIKTLIVHTLLKGNGYALIHRDNKGNAISLQLLNPDWVTIDATKEDIKYTVCFDQLKKKTQIVEAQDMIHILNFSYDGINGISTLCHARNILGLATDAESHAAGFFKGGANLGGILKVNTPLSDKQKQTLKNSWQNAFSSVAGTPNGVAVLEGNMDFETVTVNPADSQLLETRQFNIIDICRFFGVSPVKAFDLTHSSYSTIEATQLAFLTDTLSPLLEKIELELERKLYKPSERNYIDVRFDTSVLLRADKEAEASYYTKLYQVGAYSTNELRKLLDMPPVENGDKALVQVNLQTLDTIVNKNEYDLQGN